MKDVLAIGGFALLAYYLLAGRTATPGQTTTPAAATRPAPQGIAIGEFNGGGSGGGGGNDPQGPFSFRGDQFMREYSGGGGQYPFDDPFFTSGGGGRSLFDDLSFWGDGGGGGGGGGGDRGRSYIEEFPYAPGVINVRDL